VALLGAALVVGYATWPIYANDTDLWYHLNGGRYIATVQALPHVPFFSFLRPSPAWLDYYWLSQLLFYAVHAAAGYVGLVELRALAAIGTYAAVLATLRVGKRSEEGWAYTAVVFSLVALFLLGRLTMIRPGNLSYLAIAGFVFLLESRRALLALPLLAVLWVNLHGIEYPVMLLILGAYLGEWVLGRLGLLPHVTPPSALGFAATAVALLAVFVTPHGTALLAEPFKPLTFASLYIDELKPVDVPSLLALRLDGFYVTRATFLACLIGASALAAFVSLDRARIRPAHLVLLAGGAFLLTRLERFSAEFVLLAVPLLGAFQPSVSALPRMPQALRVALGAPFALLAFWHLYSVLETSCPFPLCSAKLPEGSVAFLNKVGAKGKVLNHPNDGGYLEWELYPRQQIFVDLQTPFLFSDRDIYVADQSFRDPAVLAGVIAEYHPDFAVVPKRQRVFQDVASQVSDFVPVFIDDDSVLYASSAAQPELVARHRLTAIDPFALEVVGDAADPNAVARAAEEVARVNEIYPGGGRMRVFEGALALRRGEVESALRTADAVTREHPDRPEGFRLRGDALLQSDRLAEAADAYEQALARGEDSAAAGQVFHIQSRLWSIYKRLGQREAAYRALRAAVGDLYQPAAGYRELASLASAALDAGHEEEARSLIQFALAKTPASEPELRRGLEAKLRALSAGH
jgi:hypothetical protein